MEHQRDVITDRPSDLEMRCVTPGTWLVEGVRVRRVKPKLWLIDWDTGVQSADSFNEALWKVADRVSMGTW